MNAQYVTRLLKPATPTKGDIRRLRKQERKAFLAGDVNFRLKLNFIAASINRIFFYRPPVTDKDLLPVAIPQAQEPMPTIETRIEPTTTEATDVTPVKAATKARKTTRTDKGMKAATAILGKTLAKKAAKKPSKKVLATMSATVSA